MKFTKRIHAPESTEHLFFGTIFSNINLFFTIFTFNFYYFHSVVPPFLQWSIKKGVTVIRDYKQIDDFLCLFEFSNFFQNFFNGTVSVIIHIISIFLLSFYTYFQESLLFHCMFDISGVDFIINSFFLSLYPGLSGRVSSVLE